MTFPPAEQLRFRDGLLPAVVRNVSSREILMLAWMDRDAYEKTIESGETWFWSRSRQELWHKGATSGNRQYVVRISTDCDSDSLLIDVDSHGPACHSGAPSCFADDEPVGRLDLERLEATMKDRKQRRPEGSYTASLFERGTDAILRKLGEESIEVILAVKSEGRQRVIEESADMLVHLTALLVNEGIGLDEIAAELGRRER